MGKVEEALLEAEAIDEPGEKAEALLALALCFARQKQLDGLRHAREKAVCQLASIWDAQITEKRKWEIQRLVWEIGGPTLVPEVWVPDDGQWGEQTHLRQKALALLRGGRYSQALAIDARVFCPQLLLDLCDWLAGCEKELIEWRRQALQATLQILGWVLPCLPSVLQ